MVRLRMMGKLGKETVRDRGEQCALISGIISEEMMNGLDVSLRGIKDIPPQWRGGVLGSLNPNPKSENQPQQLRSNRHSRGMCSIELSPQTASHGELVFKTTT